jgi:hypothetical protein
MSFATLIVFVLIAWDLHIARKKAVAPIQAIPPVKDDSQGPTNADDKATGSAVSTEAISPEAAPRSEGAGRKRKRKRR